MRNIPIRYLREEKLPEWYDDYKESVLDQTAELGDILETGLKGKLAYADVDTSVYKYGYPESLNNGPVVTFKVQFDAGDKPKKECQGIITKAVENILKVGSEVIRSSRTESIRSSENHYTMTFTVELLSYFDLDAWYEWASDSEEWE